MVQLPKWNGGSPVKTKPLQIVLLLLFLTMVSGMSMSTTRYGLIVQGGPRWPTTVGHRRLGKILKAKALNSEEERGK